MKKPELVGKAEEIAAMLRPHFPLEYDETGSVGKRYRRQDEIGTPFCLTIDFDSLTDDSLTVRERDSGTQERVKISNIISYLYEKFQKNHPA
jgi:glycyl-tRNA synthetase